MESFQSPLMKEHLVRDGGELAVLVVELGTCVDVIWRPTKSREPREQRHQCKERRSHAVKNTHFGRSLDLRVSSIRTVAKHLRKAVKIGAWKREARWGWSVHKLKHNFKKFRTQPWNKLREVKSNFHYAIHSGMYPTSPKQIDMYEEHLPLRNSRKLTFFTDTDAWQAKSTDNDLTPPWEVQFSFQIRLTVTKCEPNGFWFLTQIVSSSSIRKEKKIKDQVMDSLVVERLELVGMRKNKQSRSTDFFEQPMAKIP